MRIKLHKIFLKEYNLLNEGEKKKFRERRNLFLKDEFNPTLNNHPLKGRYQGYRSINIKGDLRVIYKKESSGPVFFIRIASHNRLYG